MEKKNYSSALVIAVMAIYFMPNISFVPGPALAALQADVYPNLSFSTVSLLSTVASLMMIPSSLIAGATVGKSVKYKTYAIMSALFIAIGGVLPFFITSFPLAIVCRAFVGAGIGITFPLTNTLIPGLFEEEKRPSLYGTGAAIQSASGIIYQIVSGFLVASGATVPWLIHGIILIPLVLILLYLREPEPAAVENTSSRESAQEKMPARPLFICAAHCLLFMASYPILLNISLIMEYGHYGTAALGGTISSMWTIGGVVAGVFFSSLQKNLGKYIVPLGCLEWVAGCGILAFARNVPMLFIGTLLCGIAIQTCWPATMNNYSKYVPAGKLGMASSLYTSGMCLGCFICTYFTAFAQNLMGTDNPQAPLTVGFFIALVVGAVWSFLEISRPSEVLAEQYQRN